MSITTFNRERGVVLTLVSGATGTGIGASINFARALAGQYDSSCVLVQAIKTGVFSALSFNLEVSTDGATTWSVLQQWDAISNPATYLYITENDPSSPSPNSVQYRLNCTTFTGGTSVSVNGVLGLTAPGSHNPNTGDTLVDQGLPGAINAPWPVELSDGSAAFGTSSNPLSINNQKVAGTTVSTGNGTTDAGTQRVTLSSDSTGLVKLAAGTNLVGISSSPAETSTVYNGTTALTPLFATLVASSSGATTLIALVSSKKIRVLALSLVANGAVNAKFQSHVTPTDLTGLYYCSANGGIVLPFNPVGWFQTVSGEALDINLSAAVAVGGSITYVTV
jgi:hypothetical protein